MHHARHAIILHVGELAGHLVGDIDARDRLADQFEVFGSLAFDFLIDLEIGKDLPPISWA